MSDFIVQSLDQFDSLVFYSGLPLHAYPSSLSSAVIIKELAVYKESKLTWFFRKWKEVAHLQKHKSFYGMNDALSSGYPKENSLRAILVKFIYLVTQRIHSDASILFVEKLQFLSFTSNKITRSYLKMLQDDQPSHVFFTHQRPSYLAPFLYVTIKLKITVSSFIFSWDNLSSKGRMLGSFDSFLVWSDLMKEELLYFYPKVKDSKVKVVGTPQFEPYIMDKYEMNKDVFYTNFNLDKTKKIICYSCADSSIGTNDALVIRSIMVAIRENKMNTACQLLVRTSPAEGPARFDALKNEFPEIIWNYPKWVLTRENHAESWSQRIPSDQDLKDLRAILEYANLNVNMCSTMSLDFMLFDKPVINTVFGNNENGLYDDQRFLNYDHYKKVIDSGAVTIATTKEELIIQINKALDQSSVRSQQRKDLVKLQISHDLKGTSKRIAQTLSDLNG
ncbi:hypothetical protein [Flavobacterium sp.]|uniref:hypothetical protein n=1 Tax=Flavobacterium sp. TaxID=239 RepID=UPI00261284EB|nr:hypothetical protein [Flavobacterium sp.]MDG2432748.1 hypothetical protein [Flavobacterium sp.]